MQLATKSPFAGERSNALAAARRLAAKHGLSLGEAARRAPDPTPDPAHDRGPEGTTPRPRYRYTRQAYGQADLGDKIDALRAYARMRKQYRKAEEAEERLGAAIFVGIFLIFITFGLIGLGTEILVVSGGAEGEASVFGRVVKWFAE